jgi:hypothetical protein
LAFETLYQACAQPFTLFGGIQFVRLHLNRISISQRHQVLARRMKQEPSGLIYSRSIRHAFPTPVTRVNM